MFVISIEYTAALPDVDKWIDDHLVFLDDQYKKGVFLLSGRKEPRTGGVILAHQCTRAELEAIIKLDPFHQQGVADYVITEFTPSKAAPALANYL